MQNLLNSSFNVISWVVHFAYLLYNKRSIDVLHTIVGGRQKQMTWAALCGTRPSSGNDGTVTLSTGSRWWLRVESKQLNFTWCTGSKSVTLYAPQMTNHATYYTSQFSTLLAITVGLLTLTCWHCVFYRETYSSQYLNKASLVCHYWLKSFRS